MTQCTRIGLATLLMLGLHSGPVTAQVAEPYPTLHPSFKAKDVHAVAGCRDMVTAWERFRDDRLDGYDYLLRFRPAMMNARESSDADLRQRIALARDLESKVYAGGPPATYYRRMHEIHAPIVRYCLTAE